jgi:hypothetical protein
MAIIHWVSSGRVSILLKAITLPKINISLPSPICTICTKKQAKTGLAGWIFFVDSH